MTDPSPQADRRRAPRANAAFSVNLSSEAGAEPAILRDISTIGLACTAPAPIDEMTLVGIDFALPGQTDKHHVTGAVVRCDRLPDRDGRPRWDLAVYFTDIGPATKAALQGYVIKHHR